MGSVERALTPIDEFRVQLSQMDSQFAAALPKHIPPARFARVAMTAAQNNPELLECSRKSLFNSIMKCAQDGLLPDGREAAIVVRKNWKERTKDAAYQPMIAGIRKKARNSGDISDWNVSVVYANDFFDYAKGDDPYIHHKPTLDEPGPIIAAYSIAILKDGSISREVMPIRKIHEIRDKYSESWKAFKGGHIKSTPWNDAEDSMCCKTVAHRHSKVLPMSSDLDDLMRQDDDLYSFGDKNEQPAAQIQPAVGQRRGIQGRLDDLVDSFEGPSRVIDHDEVGPGEMSRENPQSKEQPQAAASKKEQKAQKAPDESRAVKDRAEVNFTDQMAMLSDAFENAGTEEDLLQLWEDATEAWFNDAPKKVREQAEDLFETHRKRVRGGQTVEQKPDVNPAKKQAYMDGMEQARKGSRRLSAWLGKLDLATSKIVDEFLSDLNEEAAQADQNQAR